MKVNDLIFSEKEAGVYEAPEGWHGEVGVEYKLRIRLPEGDGYEAEATMPEPGFRMDAVDYAWSGGKTMGMDSLWTVGVWGYEKEFDSYYLGTHAVNGFYQPMELAKVTDDKFFNHNEVAGFPIEPLLQSELESEAESVPATCSAKTRRENLVLPQSRPCFPSLAKQRKLSLRACEKSSQRECTTVWPPLHSLLSTHLPMPVLSRVSEPSSRLQTSPMGFLRSQSTTL